MTEVLLVEDVEAKDLLAIAAVFSLTGYKKTGRPPQSDDALAIYPEEKVVRAHKKGTELRSETGEVIKAKVVTTHEMVDTLFGMLEQEVIDDMVVEESAPDKKDIHAEKLVLENETLKIVMCAHCVRKMVLENGPVPEQFKRDSAIRLLMGTILNHHGLLNP